MIGVKRNLKGKLVSPRGPSVKRIYSCSGRKSRGVEQSGGASGVNSGGERDGGEDQSGGRGRDCNGNSFADNGKAEDP